MFAKGSADWGPHVWARAGIRTHSQGAAMDVARTAVRSGNYPGGGSAGVAAVMKLAPHVDVEALQVPAPARHVMQSTGTCACVPLVGTHTF